MAKQTKQQEQVLTVDLYHEAIEAISAAKSKIDELSKSRSSRQLAATRIKQISDGLREMTKILKRYA